MANVEVTMTPAAKKVLEDALRLPTADRAMLAATLLESTRDDDEGLSQEEWDLFWTEEIHRRLEDIRSGKANLIPWEDARRIILQDTDDAAS